MAWPFGRTDPAEAFKGCQDCGCESSSKQSEECLRDIARTKQDLHKPYCCHESAAEMYGDWIFEMLKDSGHLDENGKWT